MRDVSNKPNTLRTARASAVVRCLPETISAIRTGNVPKADPLNVARVAGIQAAKNTSLLIPYCHQVPLDFVAVDMPQATRLTIHILAAVAEHEREMISKRTKAALAEAKRRGTTLGNPRLADARAKALAAHHAHRPAPEVAQLMLDWQQQGKSLREIASGLNRLNIRPPRGRAWYASSVRNQLVTGASRPKPSVVAGSA